MSINHTPQRSAQPSPTWATVSVTGQTSSTQGLLPEVALTMTDQTGAQVARAQSGSDGQFQFPGVGAGTYILIASRDGYQPHAQTLVLGAGAAAPVHLTLAAATSVHGTVHDRHSGRPVTAAVVSAVGPTGDVLASTVSDPDGRYRISGIEAGTITLVVAAPETDPVATVVQLDTGGATPDHAVPLAVDTHSALTGRVTAGGHGVAGLALTLRDPDGRAVDAVVADEAGNYRFERVKPGNYTVSSATSAPQATAVSPQAIGVDVALPPLD